MFGPEILTPGNEQVFLQNFMWPLLMCEMPKQSRAKMILYIYTKCWCGTKTQRIDGACLKCLSGTGKGGHFRECPL